MKALILFLTLTTAGTAAATNDARAADCWMITNVRTGDVGIGSTTRGENSLGRTITHRQARLVYLVNPATGEGATFRIFTGGTASTKTTWTQFVAAQTGR
jgi:hypothetical protein